MQVQAWRCSSLFEGVLLKRANFRPNQFPGLTNNSSSDRQKLHFWKVRESNPQPSGLESDALPLRQPSFGDAWAPVHQSIYNIVTQQKDFSATDYLLFNPGRQANILTTIYYRGRISYKIPARQSQPGVQPKFTDSKSEALTIYIIWEEGPHDWVKVRR